MRREITATHDQRTAMRQEITATDEEARAIRDEGIAIVD